jgi:hypothetical protein
MDSEKNKILNYLAGKMSEKDKNLFEDELKVSDSLRINFENIKNKLNEIKREGENLETDDRYFSALVPRMYERLELKKKSKLMFRISYAGASIAAAAIILFFVIAPSDRTIDFSIDNYEDLIVNNLDSNFDARIQEIVLDYESLNFDNLSVELFENKVSNNLIMNSVGNIRYVNENNVLESIDDYEYFESLTDEEFNNVYNELKNKTIL